MSAAVVTADDYVEIVRHIRDLSDGSSVDRATRQLLRKVRPESEKTLTALLDLDTLEPLVLVAPSGSGKTTELRQQARRLRAAKRPAVFAEALGVVAPQEMDLDEEERIALRGLLEGELRGVLFVDALDELHLRQRTFDELFRRLQREINFADHPVRLVFSARNGAWTPAATRELGRLLGRVGGGVPKLVAFDALDLPSISKLAAARGVTDVVEFMAEFEDEEIDDLLDLRPSDVTLLAQIRNQTGRFGKWTDVLRDYVNASFVDERADRSRNQELAADEGRHGLQRVAAASMLMKIPHVSASTVALQEGAVSSRRLFSDWSAAKLTELFENPLFVHKGREAEAVQLPQGRLSDFLAAQWIGERVRNGLDSESAREMLLVRVPWSGRFEIPQAHESAVGWLASEVPSFRKLLFHDHPGVVLYGGDPDRLSDADVREGLRHLCAAIASSRWDGWPTPATVRRLARPSLEGEVNALLAQHDSPNVLMQLMKWVEHGKYRACADHAVRLAGDSPESLVRTLAVAAVAAAAPEERAKLLSFTADEDEYVRGELLRALVPDLLKGEAFVQFVAKGGGHPVRHCLSEIADRVATVDLDAAIAALLPVLSSSTISARTSSVFEVAVPLTQARLGRGQRNAPQLVEILIALERLRHDHTQMNLLDSEEQAFARVVERDTDLRRELWRARFREVARSANAYHHVDHPQFGALVTEDIEWLWTLMQEQRANGRADARSALDRIWSRLPVEERERVVAPLPVEIRDHFASLGAAEAEARERHAAYQQAEETKHEETRRNNEAALAPKRLEIESGDNADALYWAWQHLEGTGSDRARVSPERLRRYVGDDYVQVFFAGLRACWRKMEVPIPRPGEGTPNRCSVGLTGVALAVRAGLDLSTISASEAQRAAKLALHELNSFPFWFGDLVRTHVQEVDLALREVLTLEWQYPKEDHGVMRFASYSDREIAGLIRAVVLDLLSAGPPAHPRTAHYAVDAILTSGLQTPRVIMLARREVDRAGAGAPVADWLRLWSHVEPEAAAEWFRTRIQADPATMMPAFMNTAALLEQDLNEHFGRTAVTGLMAPRPLGLWARLLLELVRPSEDITHEGGYSPGERDHAQDLRRRCLAGLAANPSAEARAVLVSIRADPAFASEEDYLDMLLLQQHTAGVEASATRWTEEDVLRLERSDEKLPRTLSELFHLVQAHLLHVHRLLANDDFSYRGVFSSRTKEREIQLWVASCLRQRARGLYSVVRENVVDDNKEVDISAFAPGVGHLPIEIKPLGDYSVAKLEGILEDQLLGQYMLPPDRRCGLLLLVRRDERKWRLNRRPVELEVMVAHLRSYAADLGTRHGKEIHVAVIDLLPPQREQVDQGRPLAAKPIKKKKSPPRASRKLAQPLTAKRRRTRGAPAA